MTHNVAWKMVWMPSMMSENQNTKIPKRDATVRSLLLLSSESSGASRGAMIGKESKSRLGDLCACLCERVN